MAKTFLIPEKMYHFPLRVFVGSYEEYSAYCKRHYGFEEKEQQFFGGFSFLVTYENGKPEGFIWLPKFDSASIGDIGTLSHECIHIALRVLFKLGISVTEGNQEPLAYLHEYFFTEALKKLK
ncbi:hypothetical protein SDC9_175631 [bioreactor metagenome]|uniref:Uncharacterized protein n=1 Tax=bioreactor metagenome TaxID=1076179 RepID=A0A645GML9_9ZZZZ